MSSTLVPLVAAFLELAARCTQSRRAAEPNPQARQNLGTSVTAVVTTFSVGQWQDVSFSGVFLGGAVRKKTGREIAFQARCYGCGGGI